MISMVPNGKCCYQAGGTAIMLAEGASPSKVGKDRERGVDEAKKNIFNNVVKMVEQLAENWSVGDSEDKRMKEATEVWKQVLGEDPQNFLNRLLEGKEWGGLRGARSQPMAHRCGVCDNPCRGHPRESLGRRD